MSQVTVAVLAGGQSRRMGTDKSFTPLHGQPIIEHVLRHVKQLYLPTILITNSPEKYAHFALPIYPDVIPACGALGGIYTAVQASPTQFTLCVACDMPFLNVALLTHLCQLCTEDFDVIAPYINSYPETMHTLYNKSCLSTIEAQLKAGNLKASAWFDRVRVRRVEETVLRQFDPQLRSFTNLNTPDDLATARDLDPS